MLVSISDFAREHGVEPQAVSRFLSRHSEFEKDFVTKGNKKMFDRNSELYRILEEKYPYPKPTVIINGLDQDEERELRERLHKAQEMVLVMQTELVNTKLLLAEKEKKELLLEMKEEKIEQLSKENELLREQIENSQKRGLLARIFNK